MIVRLDEVYAERDGTPLAFDLFRPSIDKALPLVVCIHGGGWISGEKADHHELAEGLCRHGFAAACPDYRLAPLHPFPAAVEDVQAFVRFIRENAGEFGVRPDLIGSVGNSAGGHLSVMLALTDESDAGVSSRVDAAAAICPITDLTDPHGQHFPVALGFLEQFMGGPFEGNEQRYREASPIHRIGIAAAPLLMIHGDADDIVPVGQSEALAEALQAKGHTVEFSKLEGEGHSFTLEAWNHIEARLVDFFSKRLAGVPA